MFHLKKEFCLSLLVELVFAATIFGALASEYPCEDGRRETTVNPAFLGFVQDETLTLKLEEPFSHQMGNGLFKKFWEIEILNINSLPVWMRYEEQTLELSGVVKESDELVLNLSVKARDVWHDCGNKVLLGHLTFILLNETFDSHKDKCPRALTLESPINFIKPTKGYPFILPLCHVFIPSASYKLTYSLHLPYNQPLASDHWLHVDDRTQSMFGVPLLSRDYTDEVLSLMARDSCNHKTNDALKVQMKTNLEKYSHLFYLRLNTIVSDILYSPQDQHAYIINLLATLETWFQVQGSIYLVDVDPANTTIMFTYRQDVCDEGRLKTIYSSMSYSDETVVNEFLCFMAPFFPVDQVKLEILKPCNDTDISNDLPSEGREEPSFVKPVSEHWLEIVVPFVAIIVVIVFCFICCMLCCKSGRHKKFMLKSEKTTYLDYRKPVIFPDESNAIEMAMEPRSPVVLSQSFSDSNDDRSSLLESQSSQRPPPPDYRNRDSNPNPPAYKFPPPYHSNHVNW